MPELPEVEVSRLGISPHLISQRIQAIMVRQVQLRWPIPGEVQYAVGREIRDVRRRAKYLLIDTDVGSLILHLGMSGSLRVVDIDTPVQKHDHVDIQLHNGKCLRFNDPRRFGACLWQAAGETPIELLERLGPEPLTDAFDGRRLYELSRNKTLAVKNFIMDNQIVVGVGNIYASESLFMAGVDPRKAAGKITKGAYEKLAAAIKQVLAHAIQQGGTTLKDFTQADGNPGYFAQELQVYGRAGEPCRVCENPVQSLTIGQRNSFYCKKCQR
ncbi:bifunctional DNA-formamidopyrimidine glycosylase/DNA-(apurinic or apyrimidinic site) lyase [Bowmanella sp. Y26]|uniref:bifunctional DNA-formamidopyrimidine glycosylase/DNA-(apurinic or apyrimidinic site) lyase n=1 Tax=Bowmanella yangjiangensis TaxID=2811230 RepID=UPI001BDCA23C|nr:bifunctional DNA-formamidopyrimidine glycosylase/DNA-(apurinic or apyrimidinic site) lyase [Bowmanella yangjiangensis]MBT1065784.1 bifunctional DNA-formamidopyrimidine glycosylase/DNA-(apurinic or apyrimidinic site) lyase [Bowmanella yangjiangensis]